MLKAQLMDNIITTVKLFSTAVTHLIDTLLLQNCTLLSFENVDRNSFG